MEQNDVVIKAIKIFEKYFPDAICHSWSNFNEFEVRSVIPSTVFIRIPKDDLLYGILVIGGLYYDELKNKIDTMYQTLMDYNHFNFENLEEFEEYLKKLLKRVKELKIASKIASIKEDFN